jgi:hypothetical protein
MAKNPALFYGAIAVAIIGILLGVYYLIPGVYHPLASPPTVAHYKHAALFFVLGVIGIIGAFATRPKEAA